MAFDKSLRMNWISALFPLAVLWNPSVASHSFSGHSVSGDGMHEYSRTMSEIALGAVVLLPESPKASSSDFHYSWQSAHRCSVSQCVFGRARENIVARILTAKTEQLMLRWRILANNDANNAGTSTEV